MTSEHADPFDRGWSDAELLRNEADVLEVLGPQFRTDSAYVAAAYRRAAAALEALHPESGYQ